MNYKDTVLLPQTSFPMKANLTTREPEMVEAWTEENLYQQIQEARQGRPRFILHDGPPFANGDVHMGTALNKVLKDFVVKSRSMSGFSAPFVPGWDCHGLPIEFKVVKESKRLSPIEVRKKSAELAEHFIGVQKKQFQRLGVLGDWNHPYLTMQPEYEAEIVRAFAGFVENKLVYRSKRPVYWSTGAQTALAEAEVEYEDHVSPSVFVPFHLENPQDPKLKDASVVIWTTTPWTLPANVAIAVHPSETYAAQIFVDADQNEQLLILAKALMPAFEKATGLTAKGKPKLQVAGQDLTQFTARHPFLDRTASIHNADFVTMKTGTGCVHIAPGHGADDYQLGLQQKLQLLSPVDDHGRFTEECGVPELVGLYVFDANKNVIELLRSKNALLATEDYHHTYPHCWRSKTPVVFRSVEQFFIRLDDIKTKAYHAISEVAWIPDTSANRIHSAVETRPDWCISRQRTWGVPLPIFYNPDGEPLLDPKLIREVAAVFAKEGSDAWFQKDDAEWIKLLKLPKGTTRRLDTLDVWIDSGVSHAAVLRQHPELSFPADLYLEATDQHRGWFQSSLLTSLALTGEAPFRSVLTHGFVVDKDGKKFSKSGGYQKPTSAEHFVGKYGADLVRMWVSSVGFTNEVPFGEEVFGQLNETYRRWRNSLRILLGNLNDFDPQTHTVARENLTPVDRWMLHLLQDLTEQCRHAYDQLLFQRVYTLLNNFFCNELSSIYVDLTKDRLYCDAVDHPHRRSTQTVMHEIFDVVTRLLAPILAFTADEAWRIRHGRSVHVEEFAQADPEKRDEANTDLFTLLLRLRTEAGPALEALRQAKVIGKSLEAKLTVKCPEPSLRSWAKEHAEAILEFLMVAELELVEGPEWKVEAERTSLERCERCWRHRSDVGSHSEHPGLCSRCAEVVLVMPEKA